MSNIPITQGSGSASVATDLIGAQNFQQIKLVDGTIGSSNAFIVNSDGTGNVRISGSVLSSSSQGSSVSGTVGASIVGQLPAGNAILGAVAASISGTVTATLTGSPSISGAVTLVGNASVSGTVGASVIGLPTFQTGNNSVIALIQGSVAVAFAAAANQSVSGTAGASVIGWVPVQVSNTSVISYVQNSIAAVIIGGSIAATVTPAANQSVSGTVGASIIGWAPVQLSNTSVITVPQISSLIAINAGSVVTLSQGSVIAVWQNSSVLAVPVGSVITVWQNPSVVGTYAEDAPSASGDKGFLVMGARNDTLSSVTSNDGDYSSHVVGPAGELIAANAPFTKWVSGTTSIMYGASVAVIAAQGSSIFTYVTSAQIVNDSANFSRVTFQGASGSTLGYTVAPGTGGSNIVFPNALKTNANGAFTASISGVSSVYISAQGFISKT